MTEAVKKEEIGYAWNFVADLGNGRQFSLSGNFPKGIEASVMNVEVDKVRSVFDRQQAQSAYRGAEEEIQQLELRLKWATDDYERLEAKNADKSLSASERQNREASIANIEKNKADIDFKKGILAKLKEEAK